MDAYPEKLHTLAEELCAYDEDTRFDLLIEYAERFAQVPPEIALRPFSEANRVPACESEAYIWVRELPSGGLKYYFAVENPQGISAKALAVILDDSITGKQPESIANIPEDIVYKLFGRTLSMGKGQGLMNMVQRVKALASIS